MAWRVRADEVLGLGGWAGEQMVALSSGSGWGHSTGKGAIGNGNSRFCGGETLKLSPSSRVVCKLPSELPVARDESLWDGY